MKIQTIPFVKIAAAILIGIIISIFLDPKITICFLGVLALLFHFSSKLKAQIVYVILALISFVLGHITFHQNPLKNLDSQKYEWKGIVIERGQKFSKGFKYLIEVISISNQEVEKPAKGKLLLLSKDNQVIEKGEIIQFEGKCHLITYHDTAFWDQINYKKGIQATVWSNQIHKTGQVDHFYFFLGKVQNYFEHKIHQFMKEPQSAALATGILLGDKSYMDKETKNQFIESGAAHILAVSGLHVGILTMFLNFLLGIFLNQKLKFGVIISILLSYAFITGLSPAVVRAVLMACLALIAKMFNRNYFIINILAFCFALQLILDPFIIFHLGFWLSYLAIIGIIFIQPHLVMKTKNKLYKWIQDNITVGISAQMATLPILLGFLGKFPVLFILTNLVTLPLSVIGTYCGFFLLFIAEIPYLNQLIGWITEKLFLSVLITNQWIANISFSNIQFQPSYLGLSIGLIGLITVVYILNKRKQYISENSVLNFI